MLNKIKKYILIFMAFIVLLSGCTAFSYQYYFVPLKTENNSVEKINYFDHQIFATGPGSMLLLDIDDMRIKVSVGWFDEYVITLGPPYLPIVPAFPLNWFIPSDGGYLNKENLVIHVQFHAPITISERNLIKSADVYIECNEEKIKLSPVKKHLSNNELRVFFDKKPSEIDSFQLYIVVTDFENQLMAFPSITFKKDRGTVMYITP